MPRADAKTHLKNNERRNRLRYIAHLRVKFHRIIISPRGPAGTPPPKSVLFLEIQINTAFITFTYITPVHKTQVINV
jgi:hypothetical protein